MRQLETWFDQINEQKLKPSTVISQIADQLVIDKNSTLRTLANNLGRIADQDQLAAYHNYTHTAEATAAMFEMAKLEFATVTDDQCKQAGVSTKNELIFLSAIAMLGHDVGHDGQADRLDNPTIDLEEKSAKIVANICDNANVNERIKTTLVYSIEGTAVNKFVNHGPRNRELYETNSKNPIHAIAELANEADIAASISSKYGPAKGELFAQEVEQAGNPGYAAGLRSFKGRLFFLENVVELRSNAAQQIGLLQEQQTQVRCMKMALAEFTKPVEDMVNSGLFTKEEAEKSAPPLNNQALFNRADTLKSTLEQTHTLQQN